MPTSRRTPFWIRMREPVEFRRMACDVGRTQHRMVEAGLPRQLIERLSHGR